MYIACLFVFVTGGTRSARADPKIPERGGDGGRMASRYFSAVFQAFIFEMSISCVKFSLWNCPQSNRGI